MPDKFKAGDRVCGSEPHCPRNPSMITSQDIPPEWNIALNTVAQWVPGDPLRGGEYYNYTAAIVGGALRDLALGATPKDLDIFMHYHDYGEAIEDILVSVGWLKKSCLVAAEYQTGMRNEVLSVTEWSVPYLDIPLQIISLVPDETEPFARACLNRVDFDLCQIAWDGKELHTAPGFETALERKRFTLIRCEDETQARRSQRRAARFAERYPGYLFDMSKAERFLPVKHEEFCL